MTYCLCVLIIFGTLEERENSLRLTDVFKVLISTNTFIYTYSYHSHMRDSGKADFNEVFIVSIPMIKVMLLLMLLT